MKNSLNANALFHFTPKFEYLLSILRNGFRTRYCYEEFLGGAVRFKEHLNKITKTEFKNEIIGIPMVCFCDIRLSQIKYHMNQYGGDGFGIGLSKEWNEAKLLSQVIYMQSAEKGMVSDTLQGLLMQISQYQNDKILTNSFLDLASCVKPYKGYSWDNLKNEPSNKETIFYNEREWRFIPCIRTHKLNEKKKILCENIEPILTIESNWEAENLKLEKSIYNIDFNANDVKYIIVPNNEYRDQLIKKIKAFKIDTMDLEISKIITKEQIEEDF